MDDVSLIEEEKELNCQNKRVKVLQMPQNRIPVLEEYDLIAIST